MTGKVREGEDGITMTTHNITTATGDATTAHIGPKFCMNGKCATTNSSVWKPGWMLHSGRIADLCETCGLAYEHFYFCETFHADDSGWRTCKSCHKQVHCGCIVSIFAYILLDTGGVECMTCAKKNNASILKIEDSRIEGWVGDVRAKLLWNPESGSLLPLPVPWRAPAVQPGASHWQAIPEIERQVEHDHIADNSVGEITQVADSNGKTEDDPKHIIKLETRAEALPMSAQRSLKSLDAEGMTNDVMQKISSCDDNVQYLAELGASREGFLQGEVLTREVDEIAASDTGRLNWLVTNGEELENLCDGKGLDTGNIQLEPSYSACLARSLSLCPTKEVANEACEQIGSNNLFTNTLHMNGDARDLNKFSGSNVMSQRQKQLSVKQSQAPASSRVELPKDSSLQVPVRIARPPGEGRGRNQLLPRYWPRITDQELQQITSGDSNSTITPLFEKMLSASDAGRIGRLVLPKACAEAYFPAISQPEGLPLKIQDLTGKDWSFQFRFWPNNNSRMYVLEGVTPCIQSMQLQAGDTVTFSRLDPEGKLIMGYRRAPNSMSSQDPQNFPSGIQTPSVPPISLGAMDSMNNTAKVSGLTPHVVKGSMETHKRCFSGAFNASDTGYEWSNGEKKMKKPKEGPFLQPATAVDRKSGRHLSSKKKRPRLEVEDAIDQLNVGWEEVQELLRPHPNAVPSIVTVEGHEFEEYEEPPVFGKQTVFLAKKGRPGEEQWAQCDDCGRWRKVPADVFLPIRWTCVDNVWDSKRAACSAPQEIGNEGISSVLRHTKETPSGLEALANAATLGDKNAPSSSAPTTKHPRHRPGCTCIVCIQPPSGKGPKHKPTCTCNVCTTVKRRFKTLMMRRKKRQSEHEAESTQKKQVLVKEEGEINSGTKSHSDTSSIPENASSKGNLSVSFPGASPRMNFSSSGTTFSPTATLTSGSYTPKSRSVVEEHIVGKASIDLNSQPERDEEPCKGTDTATMMMLFQNANYPLERYLQQQGLSSLSCPDDSLPFSGNGSARIDDHTSSKSVVLTSDRPSEDKTLGCALEKLDDLAVHPQIGCLQNLDLLEGKPPFQVSSRSS